MNVYELKYLGFVMKCLNYLPKAFDVPFLCCGWLC
jgi:hypothetical protein